MDVLVIDTAAGISDIVDESTKVLSFFDLAGHEKYLKTTISGMTGHMPDYALLLVGANMGVTPNTDDVFHVFLPDEIILDYGSYVDRRLYFEEQTSDFVPFSNSGTGIPDPLVGLTAQEMNAWLYHGGGMELWQEAYGQFGLVPTAAGNTGVQMAGWFNKEINTLEDLKGLKMRIPGLGGEVLRRAGGTPVNLPGGELFTSLQSGAIDATEWVGPYNDLAFGFHKIAKYYYYPGWHEPGTTLECFINRSAFEELPKDLQSIVSNACRVANQDMLTEYIARNKDALDTLVNEHKVELRELPAEVIKKLAQLSAEVTAELGYADPLTREIYDSYTNFYKKSRAWLDISERAYLNLRMG